MARTRLPFQQDLLTDVLRISRVREDVELLLEHIVRLQSETIALASAYGVRQNELATLAELSRQRIGQVADEVEVTGLHPAALRDQVDQVTEWPGDVMSALVTLHHGGDKDDPERRELQRKQIAVVYGQAEADKRHDARSAFLASLPTDPKRRAQIAEATERAQRRVFGTRDNGAQGLAVKSRPVAAGDPASGPVECASGTCGTCNACLTSGASDAPGVE